MVHAICAFFRRYSLPIDGYVAAPHDDGSQGNLHHEAVVCQPDQRLQRTEMHVPYATGGAGEPVPEGANDAPVVPPVDYERDGDELHDGIFIDGQVEPKAEVQLATGGTMV